MTTTTDAINVPDTAPAFKPPTSPLQNPMVLAAGVLVLGGAAAFFLMNQRSGLITDHARYVPETAGMFMEVKPSAPMGKRLIGLADEFLTLTNTKSSQVSLTTVYQKDFVPGLSVASWPYLSSSNTPSTVNSKPVAVSMIFSTKPNTPLKTILTDLNIPMNDYTITNKDGLEQLASKNPNIPTPAIALHKDHLILANSSQALSDVITTIKAPKTIADQPLFKDYLGKIPAQRQGTLFWLNNNSMSTGIGANNPLEAIGAVTRQFQQATPATIGAITTIPWSSGQAEDEWIRVQTVTPFDWSKIDNPTLKSDLQKLFVTTASFNMPTMLPKSTIGFASMANLSQYYAFYFQHLASGQEKAGLTASKQKLKMIGLDYDKNIIGFLDGQAGLALLSSSSPQANAGPIQGQWMAFLHSNANTQDSLIRLEAFASQAARAQVATQPLDDAFAKSGSTGDKKMPLKTNEMHIIATPFIPVAVAYRLLPNNQLVLGFYDGVNQLNASLKEPKDTLKNDGLYKMLTQGAPAQGNSIVYLNVPKAIDLVLPKTLPAGVAPTQAAQVRLFRQVLSQFDGVSFVNSAQGTQQLNGTISIKLSSAKAPKAGQTKDLP